MLEVVGVRVGQLVVDVLRLDSVGRVCFSYSSIFAFEVSGNRVPCCGAYGSSPDRLKLYMREGDDGSVTSSLQSTVQDVEEEVSALGGIYPLPYLWSS